MKEKIIAILLMATVISCSSAPKGKDLAEKYSIYKYDLKRWDVVMANVIANEATMPELYGEEHPVVYLRKNGKMKEKDFYFLNHLTQLQEEQITDDDYNHFMDILSGYVKKLPRKFFLEDSNIKSPIELVKYMVEQSNSRFDNPSKYIKEEVADKDEWNKIVEFSQKNDLDSSDVKKLRKILNSFLKKENFFNEKVWMNYEVSDRMLQLSNMNNKENKNKMELNNVNAKAMYIAYSQYFSKLDRWDK